MKINLNEQFSEDEIFMIALTLGIRVQELKRKIEEFKEHKLLADPLIYQLEDIEALFYKLNGLLATMKGKND